MKISRLRWLLVCPLLVTMLANAQAASESAAGSHPEFVSSRGVNFVSTKETSKRVLAAGGNVALVGTINLNQKNDPIASFEQQDKDKRRK